MRVERLGGLTLSAFLRCAGVVGLACTGVIYYHALSAPSSRDVVGLRTSPLPRRVVVSKRGSYRLTMPPVIPVLRPLTIQTREKHM